MLAVDFDFCIHPLWDSAFFLSEGNIWKWIKWLVELEQNGHKFYRLADGDISEFGKNPESGNKSHKRYDTLGIVSCFLNQLLHWLDHSGSWWPLSHVCNNYVDWNLIIHVT